MASTPEQALREDLAAGNVLVVAGAGVAVAASGNAPTASWRGLLESGADRGVAFAGLSGAWRNGVANDLDLGDFLSAADKVTDALGGRGGGEFKAWLRNDIGQLSVREPAILEALDQLSVPLATTNYDRLLEQSTGRGSTNWMEPSEIQQVLRRVENRVIHLHGDWQRADSVVLGRFSYAELGNARLAEQLMRAVATVRSLVFVGCGIDGLSDPHFDRLRRWMKTAFEGVEARHYRLCRDDELQAALLEHIDERIQPVAYGESYADLVPFLRGLAPDRQSGVVAVAVGVAARRGADAIVDRVRTESPIAECVPDAAQRVLDELLIPPVLLPVSPEQFTSLQQLSPDSRPERCDIKTDVAAHEVLLIVGEELAGVTTSLHWALDETHRQQPTLVPVLVDFRNFLDQGPLPLDREVRRQLSQAYALALPKDPLPELALGIDNLLVRPPRTFARTLAELKELSPGRLFLGCRQGTEPELVEALTAAGIQPVVRYLGRLTSRDALRMAVLAEPARAAALAERVMDIVRREHLPRTPQTVGLLLSLLMHGEAMMATASETALLDAYVDLLLGKGDPHDDARVGLDERDRADILATLAAEFVAKDAGSQPESEVLEILARYFRDVDWDEDPIEVLTGFKKRHLLQIRGGQVHFAQSSYLHLFAAKHATKPGDEGLEFRDRLYRRPLYYAPVIRHYAALTRNDPEVLRRMDELLEPVRTRAVPGRSFSVVVDDQVKAPPSVDELLQHLAVLERSPDPLGTEGQLAFDELIYVDDADPSPFPASDPENVTGVVRVFSLVMLASNVLRDSELVKDVALKQRVLAHTLSAWATVVEFLEQDAEVETLMRDTAKVLFEALGVPANRRSRLTDELVADAPVLLAFGGMSGGLASRKLSRALDTCLHDDAFVVEPGRVAMGVLLALAIRHLGWTRSLRVLQDRYPRITTTRTSLRQLALHSYQHEGHSQGDQQSLHDFLLDQMVADLDLVDPARVKEARAQLDQQLSRNRLVATRQIALSGTPDD